MTANTPMQRKLSRYFIALVMGWSSVYGWSQELPDIVETPETRQAEIKEDSEPGSNDTGKSSSGSDEPSDSNSPFDYQASEEISQDLSVSFPVDI